MRSWVALRARAPHNGANCYAQLTWSLTPHSPAEGVYPLASATNRPTTSVNRAWPLLLGGRLSAILGQDLPLSRTMLSNQSCLTWVVSPATGIDFQPQTCA